MGARPDETIVITGVAGFIGSNLADRLLADGYRVIGIDDLSQGVIEQVPEGVEFHRLDIGSPEIYDVIDGADVLFPLAAKTCISDCQHEPGETRSGHTVGPV